MRKKTILAPGEHRGFKRGYNAVPFGRTDSLRKSIRRVLGGSACKFNYYMNGTTISRADMSKSIERVFAYYGVSAADVWDE